MLNPAKYFLKTSQCSRNWLLLTTQFNRALIPLLLSRSQKLCGIISSREQKNKYVFVIPELGEVKSQSHHSQKSPRWAQQLYVTNFSLNTAQKLFTLLFLWKSFVHTLRKNAKINYLPYLFDWKSRLIMFFFYHPVRRTVRSILQTSAACLFLL